MKKLFVVFGFAAISAMAADVSGFVMDKKCSSNKAMVGNEACAKRCIGGGAEAAIPTEDGKIYAVSNQDKLKDFAAKKVTATGKVEGESLNIESVKVM